MSEAVCFRCDWRGDAPKTPGTSDFPCPRCGAPLYRGGGEAPRSRKPGHDDGTPASDEEVTPSPLARAGAGPLTALVGIAAVAIVLAILWTRVPKVAVTPSPSVTAGPAGTLVYAAAAAGGSGDVLWKLDLGTNTVDLGPSIPPVGGIFDASLAGTGWIGLTGERADGLEVASVLHGLSAEDVPTRLGRGRLIAWGPRGGEVAIANRGPAPGGCGPVWIDVVRVDSGTVTRAFSQRRLCGGILSLGRDSQATYFTRESNGNVGISFVGIGLRHTLLSGYAMVSVSPATDFLVTPAGGFSPQVPGVGSTVLFWRGRGGLLPFGGSKDLAVERVLAWSQDSSEALVAGAYGSVPGIYLIRAGPNGPDQAPVFVAANDRSEGAVFASDGIAYLVVDHELLRFVDGRTEPFPLPPGAPKPLGPITWLP